MNKKYLQSEKLTANKLPLVNEKCKKSKGKLYCDYDPSNIDTSAFKIESARLSMVMCRRLLFESKRKYGL